MRFGTPAGIFLAAHIGLPGLGLGSVQSRSRAMRKQDVGQSGQRSRPGCGAANGEYSTMNCEKQAQLGMGDPARTLR